MEELIVKNFGAIKDIKISLKDLTIFIGKSGTGKSTLSKLIAIFRNIDFWNEVKSFDEFFKEYQIQKFLQADTFISYKSDYLHITYKDTKLGKTNFSEKFIKEHKKLVELELVKKNTQDNIKENIKENINSVSNYNIFQSIISQSFIIPAERLLASVLVESYAVLDKENIVRTLPKPLLDFVAEFNDISKTSNNYNIPIFDVSYKKGEDGLDYIVLPDKTELLLRFAASGMQTVIPALLILEHYAQNNETKKSFTFEEPELNLFPTAQKNLVEFMAEKVLNKGHQLVICTHSPYILTSFNNLLYAHQVQKEYPLSKKQVTEVISESKFVSSDTISIYYLPLQEELEEYETYAVDLLDKDLGLMSGNELDDVSEYINNDFEQLITIYREYQRTNRK